MAELKGSTQKLAESNVQPKLVDWRIKLKLAELKGSTHKLAEPADSWPFLCRALGFNTNQKLHALDIAKCVLTIILSHARNTATLWS